MTLARARRTQEERVFPLSDEACGRQLVDQGPVRLAVELEVGAVQGAIGIPEAGLLVPPLKQPVLAAEEFIGHERGGEIKGGEALGLRVAQARLEDVGHAREVQFAERVIEFDEVHIGSPVWRSIRSQ